MVRAKAARWRAEFSDTEWSIYLPVLEAAQREQVPFAIGGGIAMSYYSGMWRDTKDVDLYVTHADVATLRQILEDQGFEDYYGRAPYDRRWIYRGFRGGYIVDLIWQLANYRAEVEPYWLRQAELVEMHGSQVGMLPAEELIFAKLYVMQRERCDWPDLLNILWARGRGLDWPRMMEMVGEDWALVGGLLSVFGWLCPAEARELPDWLWARVGVAPPIEAESAGEPTGRMAEAERERRDPVRLLDSRPWFAPRVLGVRGRCEGS